MAEHILKFLEQAGTVISLFAVLVVVAGFALAAARYTFGFRKVDLDRNFKQFKIQLGRALILGLELLVLADVIETITVKPTFQSLGVLALIVAVRTVVSWTLTLEIEGRWPWQTSAEDQAHA